MKITESSGNIFQDLGFEKEEAANLLVRAELMVQIRDIINKRGLKQNEAKELLGVEQPDISAIKNLKVEKFSIDRLVVFLSRLNRRVEVTTKKVHSRNPVIIDTGCHTAQA
tara:strand:- start:1805 stop:2137 length:333 start_codon:yes stop_codon:yes gene_type:complete